MGAATSERHNYYEHNWDIFASSLALLLKTVLVPALLRLSCHGGHEET